MPFFYSTNLLPGAISTDCVHRAVGETTNTLTAALVWRHKAISGSIKGKFEKIQTSTWDNPVGSLARILVGARFFKFRLLAAALTLVQHLDPALLRLLVAGHLVREQVISLSWNYALPPLLSWSHPHRWHCSQSMVRQSKLVRCPRGRSRPQFPRHKPNKATYFDVSSYIMDTLIMWSEVTQSEFKLFFSNLNSHRRVPNISTLAVINLNKQIIQTLKESTTHYSPHWAHCWQGSARRRRSWTATTCSRWRCLACSCPSFPRSTYSDTFQDFKKKIAVTICSWVRYIFQG